MDEVTEHDTARVVNAARAFREAYNAVAAQAISSAPFRSTQYASPMEALTEARQALWAALDAINEAEDDPATVSHGPCAACGYVNHGYGEPDNCYNCAAPLPFQEGPDLPLPGEQAAQEKV